MTESTPASALVLFDIDGTLLRNAGGHHKEALIGGIRAVTGLATTLEGVATTGMLDRDLIRGMLLASGMAAEEIRSLMQQVVHTCQEFYLNNCATDLSDRICPGLPRLLQELQSRGAVMGLVTGNLTAIGWKKMELTGLRPFFTFGTFSERARSRARLAQAALAHAVKTGLVDRQCRVSLVGDHANDVAAAKANRFLSVGVATGLMPYEELRQAGPDILVHDLTELDPGLLV